MKLNSFYSNSLPAQKTINFTANDKKYHPDPLTMYALCAVATLGIYAAMNKGSHDIMDEHKNNLDKIFNKYELTMIYMM